MYVNAEYLVVCGTCGKEFTAHDKRKKFCSRRCKDISSRQNRGIKGNTNTEPFHKECVICGKSFDTFRDAIITCSPECAAQRHKQSKSKPRSYEHTAEEWKQIRKIQAKQRAEQKEIEKAWIKAINTVERECVICGSLFYCLKAETKKTCSHDCSVKYKKIRDRERHDSRLNKNNIVDFDITLEKLFKRDSGKCYLCGGDCDKSDFVMREDIKICGINYPSIEHVIPLSRGGTHSWENVRLAHLGCNIAKGDTTPTYTKEMSREHARKLATARVVNRKRTAQYSLDRKLLKVWNSTAQIKRDVGLNDKHIQNVCRGDNSNTGNAYGFHWEYIS